jgi:hypothetical protein
MDARLQVTPLEAALDQCNASAINKGRRMGLTFGWVSLGLGIALVLVGMPRRDEECRPFLRGSLMPIVYPSLCLLLISAGLVTVTAGSLR